MKLTSLANLISGAISAAAYSAQIAEELAEHTRYLGRGSSARVLVNEDTDLVLDRHGLSVLCRLFASGQLTAGELAYTADVLQMAERVEYSGPNIADDLDVCTDPEINGPMTAARALEIADRAAAA
jgi:hypothetical protein